MYRRRSVVVGVVAVALAWSSEANAYTAWQVGVGSNLFISDRRVIFIQADSTLTALDLSTGDVLARRDEIDYWGTLLDCPAGIALRANDEFALLDRRTLDIIWHLEPAYDPAMAERRVVANDGNGLVTCRTLETGRELWTYNLPGALQYVVAAGRVMVYRAATYEEDTEPILVLLDLQTGQELLRKAPPPGTYFLAAHFDGERIYLPAGPDEGKRSEVRFERLVVWDLQGREISAEPVPAEETELPGGARDFTFGGLRFQYGEVFPAGEPGGADAWQGNGGSVGAPGGRRRRDIHLSGPAHQYPEGILIGGDVGELGLVHPRDGDVVWHCDVSWQVSLAESKVVSLSRDGRAECRDLASGQLVWTHDLPEAQGLAVQRGKVLHYRSPNLGQPVVTLLELATGRELFRKRTPVGTRFHTVYFDGERIYLPFGNAEGGQVAAAITRLAVWDTSGAEVSSRDLAVEWDPFEAPVTLDGMVFDGRDVHPVGEPPKPKPPYVSFDRYPLSSGRLTLWRIGERPLHLRFDRPNGTWRGCLSYLGDDYVAEVAEADGKLLLGTNRGHVECIDIASGRSQWVYVFPAIYRTMSFSTPHGLPPRLGTQARLFRDLNKRPPDLAGMILLPDSSEISLDGPAECPRRGTRPGTRVVHDPQPTDPYADLSKLLAFSWMIAVLPPLVFLTGLIRSCGKPHAVPRVTALGVLGFLAVAATFAVIGRAADSTCAALKLSMILSAVLLLVAIGKLYAQRRWIGATAVLAILGVIGWYFWPGLLYS